MKKLAVVTCGWHYPSDFYDKIIKQKVPNGWEVKYFCASHRDPKFAWEEKKQQVDDIVLEHDNELYLTAQKLDKKMYKNEVTIEGLQNLGWIYKEYPNTVGGWGAFNQWFEDNDYKEYDAIFFCDDDLFFTNNILFEDIFSEQIENHFKWDDWLVISNSRNLDPGNLSLRGSSEFFKKEMLDIMGGKFDLGNPTLFRENEVYTPENPEHSLGDWNCTVVPMRELIKEKNLEDKIKFLSPYYRVSAYMLDTERGFFSRKGFPNMIEGFKTIKDMGLLNEI